MSNQLKKINNDLSLACEGDHHFIKKIHKILFSFILTFFTTLLGLMLLLVPFETKQENKKENKNQFAEPQKKRKMNIIKFSPSSRILMIEKKIKIEKFDELEDIKTELLFTL